MLEFEESLDCSSWPAKRRCPLHKLIRNHSWSLVSLQMKRDPSLICFYNNMGWSSLTLSIYHSAPPDIIFQMLSLISSDDRKALLSTPVPNGSRLCLHFAARFSSNLDVIKSLTEPYPCALLVKSNDGVTPLDRALYYRQDPEILNWLEAETQKQKDFYEKEKYNQGLRATVIKCCNSRRTQVWSFIDVPTNEADFVVQIYGFFRDREMFSLFWNVLSYVGVHSIPSRHCRN